MRTRPDGPSSRPPTRTRYAAAAVTFLGLLVALIGASMPANAATTLPIVRLTGGAAVVSYTYTATSIGEWPAGTELHYQWYRGDHDASTGSFVPIQGATAQKYTLTGAEHLKTVLVEVSAVQGYDVVAQTQSPASNWIMLRMQPPTLHGTPHVGQLITATLGPWAAEWWTTLTWRNTGVPIPGASGLTYRARPADAGKEISLLAYGEYEYANGVHPIDRYASRMRIRWATTPILRGTSPARGVLRLTSIAYAAGTDQSTVRGRVTLYDGSRRVAQFWVPHGRRLLTFKNLRSGVHRFTMTFEQNPWFDASTGARSFRVR